jgi:hypothetical protein
VSVTLRTLLAPDALIARPPLAVVLIVPELMIWRFVDALDHMIALVVVVASLPVDWTVTLSVPPTVFATVSVTPAAIT